MKMRSSRESREGRRREGGRGRGWRRRREEGRGADREGEGEGRGREGRRFSMDGVLSGISIYESDRQLLGSDAKKQQSPCSHGPCVLRQRHIVFGSQN